MEKENYLIMKVIMLVLLKMIRGMVKVELKYMAKEFMKEYLEMSAGLDAVDDLDELIKIWDDIFGEDITEW